MSESVNLADALPAEIKRVRRIQDNFKSLRGLRNVMVEPQIAMMERDLDAAINAMGQGDTVAMLSAYEELTGWRE